jgi:hypothetical protein
MSSPQSTESSRPPEWSDRQTVHSPVLSAQNARQAATGQNVRYVLGIGVGAIVIVFLIIYFVYFG